MTFSPLISGTVPHHNKFSSRAGRPVTRLIQHHWAGTGGGIERMTDPGQQASCTYIITSDGRILGHVPEEYRPWTSGSAEADAPSITIEVQNTGGQVNGNDSDPASWPISDAAYAAIIRLLVDVAQRHGWSAIDSTTYVGHRQFYSTACPGGFLWARMDQTRQLAQQAFTGGGITFQSTATEEDGFLMALSDQDQDNIYKAISRIDKWLTEGGPVAAVDEALKSPQVLDRIALAILKRECYSVDPATGQTNGTTTLARKINWMAHNDQAILSAIVDVSKKLDVAHPVLPAEATITEDVA